MRKEHSVFRPSSLCGENLQMSFDSGADFQSIFLTLCCMCSATCCSWYGSSSFVGLGHRHECPADTGPKEHIVEIRAQTRGNEKESPTLIIATLLLEQLLSGARKIGRERKVKLFDKLVSRSPHEYFKNYSPARYPLFDISTYPPKAALLRVRSTLVCRLKHRVTMTQRDLAAQRHRISRCRRLSDHVLKHLDLEQHDCLDGETFIKQPRAPESSHFREYEPPTRVWQRLVQGQLAAQR